MDSEIDFVEDAVPVETEVEIDLGDGASLRDYQRTALERTEEGWRSYNRQLLVLAGGGGKTIIASHLIKKELSNPKGRCLFLAHTDELLDQAADKLYKSTGIQSDKEKASDHASLSARVVIASVQTLSRDSRLLGFPDDHFTLVICDEAHRSMSFSHQKILCYFHFGEASLDEAWVMPEPGFEYRWKAKILGLTATPRRGDKKSLGQFYQAIPFEFGLLDAVKLGYLVRPIVVNVPLKIDLKAHKSTDRVMSGNDYNPEFVAERIRPILREIAHQIKLNAANLKTICFLPGVETARLLSEALCDEGMDATFVSGACPDRAEKMAEFRLATKGSVLCNALLVVEGVDIPDVSCVCILRGTKIWSFYVQASVRGTRTLPGVIDGLKTADERLAAIAASAKPNFTLLDFLWLSDKHDLIHPIDLVATRAEVRQKMAEAIESGATTDLLNLEATATRDLMKSLEAAARKHANKQARVIDPLSWAVSLGDAALANFEPVTIWDELPATQGQLDFIRKAHIDTTHIVFRGHANKIIARLLARMKTGLATPLQLNFLKNLGVPEDKAMTLTIKEASATCDAILKEKQARRSIPT